MFSRDYEFAAGGSNREAVDGFAAIAAALDHGIDANAVRGGGIVDAIAITLGWLVLAAVIFYPALQLAAIATCAAFMCMRSFIRCVLGSSFAAQAPAFSHRGRAGSQAA
jgi:hypothetical protein